MRTVAQGLGSEHEGVIFTSRKLKCFLSFWIERAGVHSDLPYLWALLSATSVHFSD